MQIMSFTAIFTLYTSFINCILEYKSTCKKTEIPQPFPESKHFEERKHDIVSDVFGYYHIENHHPEFRYFVILEFDHEGENLTINDLEISFDGTVLEMERLICHFNFFNTEKSNEMLIKAVFRINSDYFPNVNFTAYHLVSIIMRINDSVVKKAQFSSDNREKIPNLPGKITFKQLDDLVIIENDNITAETVFMGAFTMLNDQINYLDLVHYVIPGKISNKKLSMALFIFTRDWGFIVKIGDLLYNIKIKYSHFKNSGIILNSNKFLFEERPKKKTDNVSLTNFQF